MQDDIGNFLPVSSLNFRVQKPQIGNHVLFVIFGQDASAGRGVGDGRVKRGATHSSTNQVPKLEALAGNHCAQLWRIF